MNIEESTRKVSVKGKAVLGALPAGVVQHLGAAGRLPPLPFHFQRKKKASLSENSFKKLKGKQVGENRRGFLGNNRLFFLFSL